VRTDLQQLFDELLRRGVPNYFGPQRQGRSGTNFQLGAELLQDRGASQYDAAHPSGSGS
jgi:tRNA(Glu) U13 pseudouridine synthase TruD